jgi:hypothetical protein
MTDPAYIFLWRALAIFLLIGALSGVALSLLLIFKPEFLGRVNRVANRWISTRHFNRWADRSVNTEQWFYKYHRTAGIVIVLGASYLLLYFSILFNKAYTLKRWSGVVPDKLLEGLLDAMVLGSLIGSVVALIAGLFLWLRPSLLRGMEEDANQWVSLRRATKVLDVPHHDQVDRFVERHAQRVGWLLLLGSIYLFSVMFHLLA